MESMSFEDLGLDEITLKAVEKKGFEVPSPIQVLAIPRLLNGDANIIAKARTGTGKTAAFGLPIVQRIREDKGYPQALILTPTRELALQVNKEIESFTTGKYPRMASVYGGQSMGEQLKKLRGGVEIVVGTPGRVIDHLERGSLKIDKIDYFILDEADEMLDMGFIDDIEEIFSKANPSSRVLLFSATMPAPILKIAAKFMGDYEIVQEEERPEEPILTDQKYILVRESEKINALVRIIDIADEFYGLVFTQTKADADMIAKELDERGYEAAALHGDIPQNQREKILNRFRKRKTKILVATDVAARGIDIGGLTHVVNYAMPFDGPTYVHRIGRTGRAGAKGEAYTLVCPSERRKVEYLKKVSKGNLKEVPVPSIEEVLTRKKERLFTDILSKMSFLSDSEEEQSLKNVSEDFVMLAEKLSENQDMKQVLASVLSLFYGKELDASRYGEITPVQSGSSRNKDQLRLYVGLGRKDGYGRAEIAKYFAQLLQIPNRLVDRIEVAEKFSLINLPADSARSVIEMSKNDKSLPNIHIDSKSEKDDFSGERSSRRERGRFSKSFGRGEKRSFEHGDKKGFDKKRTSSKSHFSDVQKAKTSNASLYRRKSSSRSSSKASELY